MEHTLQRNANAAFFAGAVLGCVIAAAAPALWPSVASLGGQIKAAFRPRADAAADVCEWTYGGRFPNLEACLCQAASAPRWQAIAQRYSALPKLGIVQTLTYEYAQEAGLHHIESYAARCAVRRLLCR